MNLSGQAPAVVATQTIRLDLPPEGFRLEMGGVLPELHVAYETYGRLSPAGDNAVFLCHALSGSAHAAGRHEPPDDTPPWWDNMIGPGKGIDTAHYFVICANILGGCKGTTGPSSVNPSTGKPYGSDFPHITIGDMVAAHALLLKHMGIKRLAAVAGGSMGGMQALEWAIRFPDTVDRCICIASAASLSAQGLAFDIIGRKAITSDPHWHEGDFYGTKESPESGLSLARKVGHITYLSQEMMDEKFGRERTGAERGNVFQVESYLDHQGDKFVKRFDANSYLHITRAIDEFDLVERYGTLENAFRGITAKMLVVAISTDWLFPPEGSMEIANALLRAGKDVSYCEISATHGHDAFLADVGGLAAVIRAFLPWVSTEKKPASAAREQAMADDPRSDEYIRRRKEFDTIVDWVRPGTRVLDLGCGDGKLLSLLAEKRRTSGLGIDIDLLNVTRVIDAGHDIFQKDMDIGLGMIPDGAYDCAILVETLQVVHKPRFVLNEILRVAREGIVSFPNFGNWSNCLKLSLLGRMPKSAMLPFDWHETPNIHLFTLKDFLELCRKDGIRVLNLACIPAGPIGRLLLAAGCRNRGADCVIARIARES